MEGLCSFRFLRILCALLLSVILAYVAVLELTSSVDAPAPGMSRTAGAPVVASETPQAQARWIAEESTKSTMREYMYSMTYSSHTCVGETAKERVCTFENVYIWNGTIYYVSEDLSVHIPAVHMVWLQEQPFERERALNLVVVAPHKIPEALAEAQMEEIQSAIFWNRVDRINNYYHMVAEHAVTIHKLMCQYLGFCMYGMREALNFRIIFVDHKSESPWPAINDAFKCLARLEPLYFRNTLRTAEQAWIVRKAVAGIGPECRAFYYCMGPLKKYPQGRSPIQSLYLKSFRELMIKCVGADLDSVAGDKYMDIKTKIFHKPLLLVVQRAYSEGRTFLNIEELELELTAGLPLYEVKVLDVDSLDFASQLLAFNKASVAIMMHGAAFGNVPFMPVGGRVIEVMPNNLASFHEYYRSGLINDFKAVTNVSLIAFDVFGDQNHLRSPQILADENYKRLSASERLALLEKRECPQSGPWAEPAYRRRMCEVTWLMKATDCTLNATEIIQVVNAIDYKRPLQSLSWIRLRQSRRSRLINRSDR